MKTQYLFWISLLCLLGMLYACVHDPTSEPSSNTQSDLLTVSAARELVERQMSLKTRSHTTPAKGLVPGDFSPLWSDAKTSQNAKVGSVDVPILPQYTYYALRTEEKNGKIKVHKVRISQKVVVIKAKDNGRLASYLLTLIPDGNYYSKNKNKFDEFLNSGSHKFSGVAVYYDLHARYTVRVDKYANGHKTAGVYLMCDSKDWNKRFKIAKKILGPIRIAKSANKMTRSFDEDEPDPCDRCGDPWCWGDCEEEEWLYCWNCGSPWCSGDCDDDPIIITPDYCSGCGEYEFNCTCNVCSWCGSDPCTCDDTCSWCGNDPCTCGVCPDCGDDPCTCEEWECPKCGNPYCLGECDKETEIDKQKCTTCGSNPCKCCLVCQEYPCICCSICNQYPCKCPCKDLIGGKSNPLPKMELAPPSASNPRGAAFGNTRNGGTKFHQGIDLAGAVGDPVYAAHSGTIGMVIKSQPNKVNGNYPTGYSGDRNDAGNRIYVNVGNGTQDAYWHLQAGTPVAINPRTNKPFQEGDQVEMGDIIGYVGITGNANAAVPHLHFGVRRGSTWQNPFDTLNATLHEVNNSFSITTPCDE